MISSKSIIAQEDDLKYLSKINAFLNSANNAEISIVFVEPITIISTKQNTGGDIWQINVRSSRQRSLAELESALLVELEQIRWKNSAQIPFLKVVLEPMSAYTSRLYLYFSVPVKIEKVSSSRDFRNINVILDNNDKDNSDKVLSLSDQANGRLRIVMERARNELGLGNFSAAINIFTAVLEEPTNLYSQEALELLGLARERNGQKAHANAEYEKYLTLYPEGAGTNRVKQRLAGLITSTQAPKEKLRVTKIEERRQKEIQAWEVFGNLDSRYQRIQTQGDGIPNETTGSDVVNGLDIFARYETDLSESEFRLSSDYISNLLDDNRGDELKIGYAFFEHQMENGFGVKIGRQRHNQSGASNRFDGAVMSYSQSPKIKYSIDYGAPVEQSSNSFINKDKSFYSINTELGTFSDHWNYSFYFINQGVGHVADRQAVGGEMRYFDPRKSFFGLIDYDLLFDELNIGFLTSNFYFPNGVTGYINMDHRYSPSLTLSNALQGQTATTVDELLLTMEEDQIRQIALDRSAITQSVAIGGSMPWSENLTLSGDVSVSKISATSASAGVEATPESGNDYIYSVNLIKSGLFSDRDIGVLSLQYLDGSNSETIAVTASSRFVTSSKLRLNSRLRISQRKNRETNSSQITLEPNVSAEYRISDAFHIDADFGIVFREATSNGVESDSQDYLFNFGLSWNF